MKRNVLLALTLVALGAASVLTSCSKQSGRMSFGDNEYAVRTAGTSDAELETSYPATIRGVQDVEIRPKVSGFITKLNVSEGQLVHQGQVLFVIDNVTYEAAVKQASAAVEAAQAQAATAKLTYDNSKKLYDSGVIGSFELQSVKNQLSSAEAALAQAKANYTSAKQNLDFCYVTSPANGVVGDLPYKVGALVSSQSQQPLTTVSDISSMQVYFSMTEKELLAMTKAEGGLDETIKSSPAVKLVLTDGTTYGHDGKIAAISGVIDQATGSVSIRADFPNPEKLLKSGGSGSIVLPYVSHDAIIIPQEAVSQVQDRYFVFVVGADNKVKHTEVKVDPNNDGKNYIITSGLQKGDKYVANGINSLTDGMEITPLTDKQYEEKMKKAKEMGSHQDDLQKLKKDFGQ